MKFQCYTLGCKVNQYETQAMEQQLLSLGHELGKDNCDLYILNTCTVTAVADRKNRTLLRRLRREHPNAIIGVSGCYAQLKSEEVKALGADVISGSGGREEFVQMLLHASREKQQVKVDEALKRRSFEHLPAGSLAERTRAMLKVQDGCSNFCSYCIIPYARGPVRSLPLEQAVRDATQLATLGYREIVLTGIEVASWGRDLKDGGSFTELCSAVCAAAPNVRIRLGSLEPRVIDEEFCQTMATHSNFCPQFHLSLQSGCDSVLSRMRRKYDTARYFESVERLKRHFPDCAITTDLIVGFPGETEEEFAASLAFAERCGFASMLIFPYSRREGTPAAAMDGQILNSVKSERAAKAGALAKTLKTRFDTALIGTEQEILFEQREGEYFTGHAKNGVKVYAEGEDLHNQLRRVRVLALKDDGILAQICQND